MRFWRLTFEKTWPTSLVGFEETCLSAQFLKFSCSFLKNCPNSAVFATSINITFKTQRRHHPEVQNRAISGPTKRTIIIQNFILKNKKQKETTKKTQNYNLKPNLGHCVCRVRGIDLESRRTTLNLWWEVNLQRLFWPLSLWEAVRLIWVDEACNCLWQLELMHASRLSHLFTPEIKGAVKHFKGRRIKTVWKWKKLDP